MDAEDYATIERRMDSLIDDHTNLLRTLVHFRKEHGLTQSDVAERMGVSQPTVAEMERYDANPTLSTVRRYALAVEARLSTKVVDDSLEGRRNRAGGSFATASAWTQDESYDLPMAEAHLRPATMA